MKKAWPWIIVGVLALIAVIVIFSKKKTAQKAGEISANGSPAAGTTTQPSGYTPVQHVSGSTFVAEIPAQVTRTCACEEDPQVQQKVTAYNSNAFPFNSPSIRAALKEQILADCPCIKF